MFADQSEYEMFCRQFNTDQACADLLFQARWPDGFRCPACAHPHFYLINTRRLPLYECRSCGRQTSVIAGTIMEGSSTPLPRWFQALFLLAQPAGISSTRLSEELQITYKTAWLMSHKIRHAMQQADKVEALSGVVRIDHIYYGSSQFFDARQPLLIGGSLGNRDKPHHVKIKQPDPSHIKNDSRRIQIPGIESFVKNHLTKKSVKVFAERGGVRNPHLNRIGGDVNRWLNDTFHGIGAKHLQTYLDEFCFRLNLKLRRVSILDRLLHWCAASHTLIYKDLIRSRPVLPVPWLVLGSKAKWKGRYLSLWNA